MGLLQKVLDKIDALSLRERVLLLIAVIAVPLFIWDQMLMTPVIKQQQTAEKQVESIDKRLKLLDGQIKEIMQRSQEKDPNSDNREQLGQYSAEIAQLDREIATLAANLIPPQEMVAALRKMLSHNPGLVLWNVENLPVKPLLEIVPEPEKREKVEAEQDVPRPPITALGIFRHGVVITFEGDYKDTVTYLKALEDLSWLFYWKSIDYEVDEFPKAKVTISVFTLSLEEGWIGV